MLFTRPLSSSSIRAKYAFVRADAERLPDFIFSCNSPTVTSSNMKGFACGGVLAATASTRPALSAGRVLAVAARTPPQAKPFMFEEVTVGELQEKMKSGSLSASALTKAYLARIEELDKGRVNSMIEINHE